MNKYIAPLLNEGNNLAFGDYLSGGLIKKNQPLKTTIDIPIILSYKTKLQRLQIGLWVVTFTLQTSIWLDFSKKVVFLQLQ